MSEDELIEWFSYFEDIFEAASAAAIEKSGEYAAYFNPAYIVPVGDTVYIYDEFGDSITVSIKDVAKYTNE